MMNYLFMVVLLLIQFVVILYMECTTMALSSNCVPRYSDGTCYA